jgi:hypothetical protein
MIKTNGNGDVFHILALLLKPRGLIFYQLFHA